MKKTGKLLALLLAFVMVFGMVAPNIAAEDVTETVTLHKLVMTDKEMEDWNSDAIQNAGYDGSQNMEKFKELLGAKNVKEIGDVYFALKFGTDYSDDKLAGKYVKADSDDKTKPADPLAATDKVEEAVGGLTTKEDGLKLKTSTLKGSFEIDEVKDMSKYKDDGNLLTGSKAVPVKLSLPIANKEGIISEAHVYPKNSQAKPKMDKNFAEDTKEAENKELNLENNDKVKDTIMRNIGDKVKYQVETSIPKGAKYKKLVWTDSMTNGLTFNKDLKVTFTPDAAEAFNKDKKDYNVYSDNHGFRLEFTDAGLDKLAKLAETQEVRIRFEYSATVNSAAKVGENNTNDIALDYSNKPNKESEPKEVKPKDKQIKVSKTWASDGNAITKADENVKATFILQEKQGEEWVDVDSYTATTSENFEHIFENLDDSKTYRVIERVVGYDPKYISTNEDGIVVIKNNKDSDNPPHINPSEPKVVTGGKKFVKTGLNDARLAGAEFEVYDAENGGKKLTYTTEKDKDKFEKEVNDTKKALDKAIEDYNKLTEDEQKKDESKKPVDEAQAAYNAAVKKAAQKYEWDGAGKPVTLVSDAQGRFEITGLAGGTYYLQETKAPNGYALLSGRQKFVVNEGSYKGEEKEMQYDQASPSNGYGQKVENKKVTIPQTGGIGTVIFTVAGIAIMASAAYVLAENNKKERV